MNYHRAGLPILAFAVVVVAWQIVAVMGEVPRSTLPPPLAVMSALIDQRDVLLTHAIFTTSEALAGFALAALLGLGIGLVLTSSRLLHDLLYPNLVALQVIPKIALAPLFVVWFGIGTESRLILATFISFFPVAIATSTGLMEADSGALRLCRSLGASRGQTLLHVRIPCALPFIFDGLKVAATLSMIGVVVGEFISSRRGLGYFILNASSRIDTASVMAAIVTLCLAGLGIYGLTVLLERAVMSRWGPL